MKWHLWENKVLNNYFKNKFPFAFNYFSNLLDLTKEGIRDFPQALIFEGADTKNQYLFALELARILNCQNNGEIDCDCINCRWIKSHSHPCVNNVSQIHFKGENDETKTVISVKQAAEIEKSLSLSSDYHRFFIFFSSREYNYAENELACFRELLYDDNINYSIEPLNYQTFNPATLNALLKSIEEPPKRTTFIFLTKSREDILATIVSRCLVFKLSGEKTSITYNDILNIISNYHNITYQNCIDLSDMFQKYIKDENINIEEILNKILEYLKDLLKKNISNSSFVLKINNDIKIVNEAIKYKKANMQDKIILDTMFLKIARGY